MAYSSNEMPPPDLLAEGGCRVGENHGETLPKDHHHLMMMEYPPAVRRMAMLEDLLSGTVFVIDRCFHINTTASSSVVAIVPFADE